MNSRLMCEYGLALSLFCILTLTQAISAEKSTMHNPSNVDHIDSKIPVTWPSPVNDNELNNFTLIDLLEYSATSSSRNKEDIIWDALTWVGTDKRRLWLKSEGTHNLKTSKTEADLQALYGAAITAFFDLQIGLQYERALLSTGQKPRLQGVLGLQGLAPYIYEVESALFIGENGELSARLNAAKDLLLTQRIIIQARLESIASDGKSDGFEREEGINDIQLGIRARYEIRREFAPYVGITWKTVLGSTKEVVIKNGDDPEAFAYVGGIRVWF